MANNKIGDSPVGRRTLCLENSDWKDLNDLVIVLKLNGVSSLFRAFLRTYSKHKGLLLPLLQEAVKENDRIQPETKSKTLQNNKAFHIEGIEIKPRK